MLLFGIVFAVHPRRCGEHLFFFCSAIVSAGSSPQVRGTRSLVCSWDQRHRFIPAGAGNTESGVSHGWTDTVHPRRCGEHWTVSALLRHCIGSSPQVRGTRFSDGFQSVNVRFIPAGAGNTDKRSSCCSYSPVHPRRCGEHLIVVYTSRPTAGSSPQVRGTLANLGNHEAGKRFIPAGAGNTTNLTILMILWTVHPRRCGEHKLGI